MLCSLPRHLTKRYVCVSLSHSLSPSLSVCELNSRHVVESCQNIINILLEQVRTYFNKGCKSKITDNRDSLSMLQKQRRPSVSQSSKSDLEYPTVASDNSWVGSLRYAKFVKKKRSFVTLLRPQVTGYT